MWRSVLNRRQTQTDRQTDHLVQLVDVKCPSSRWNSSVVGLDDRKPPVCPVDAIQQQPLNHRQCFHVFMTQVPTQRQILQSPIDVNVSNKHKVNLQEMKL